MIMSTIHTSFMTQSRLKTTSNIGPSFYSQRQKAKTTAASSRLEARAQRQEQEKYACRYLQIQIFLIMLLIAGSGIAYLVFIFPFLVQWTGQINSQKYEAPDHTIRPQMPLLNAPPSYTNEQTLTISGFATPSTWVQFVVNNQVVSAGKVPVGLNGEFSVSLELEEGENTLQAYSFDDNGLQSNDTKVYTVTLDTQKPPIDLESPENHQQFHGRASQIVIINGHTEPGARVLVNTSATRADVDGFFKLEYRLSDGDNNLEIVATDKAENENKITISVNFQP